MNPPLKWVGGKRWLLPTLEELWQKAGENTSKTNAGGRLVPRRLVEPFVGGGAMFFAVQPRRALLNDSNFALMNFYKEVKRGLDLFEVGIMENESDYYYATRVRFNDLLAEHRSGGGLGAKGKAEAAALFYYLNRTGFNGLCRFNQSGEYNVPMGRYKTITYRKDFGAERAVLRRARLTEGDFSRIQLQHDDFVYADPPYDMVDGGTSTEKQSFTAFAPQGFNWADQVRLAGWLAKHTGPVVASNINSQRITALYRGLGFSVRRLLGPRRVSCTGNRNPVKEVLMTKGIL